jgi:hypothetical protein
MKITIISLDNWGFNKHIKNALEEEGHKVNYIDFNKFNYKYPNLLYKLYNFFLKLFLKKNLKAIYYGKKINQILKENTEIQDLILTIKGDFIDPKEIQKFKNYTKKSVAFFNDSVYRCPRIIRVLPNFDEVFSFEKKDCVKFNLNFAPNWIYNYSKNNNKELLKREFKYKVFNITTRDNRLSTVIKIAKKLKSINVRYKILLFDKKVKTNTPFFEYISEHITLEEINNYINDSQVLLDINRKGQEGLTFRVLESLGLQKKIITTNKDIKNYDFYNPNNILIINEKKPEITIDFFKKDYEKIPENIFQKYTLKGWIDKVIYNNIK